MRRTISTLALLTAAFMLSGCLYPYWADDGYYGGGGRRGGHHDNGRGNGGRR